jgi:hypothetical protein
MFRTTASVDDPSSRTILVHPPKGDRSRTETFQIQRRLWNVSKRCFGSKANAALQDLNKTPTLADQEEARKLTQGNIRSVGAFRRGEINIDRHIGRRGRC